MNMEEMIEKFKKAKFLVNKFLQKLNQEEVASTEIHSEKDHTYSNIFSSEKLSSKISLNRRISSLQAYKRVQQKIAYRRKKAFFYKTIAYAAISLLFFGTTGWLFFNNSNNSLSPDTNVVDIEAGTTKAILILGNGKKINLQNANSSLINADSSIVNRNHQLIYNPQKHATRSTDFNTLYVPNGGMYSVTLSDGTRVWLNSESSLRYPINFTTAERRVVLSGEAYFDVARNEAKPFIVEHAKFKVKVLGTVFNINAYEKDTDNSISLLSGKIQLNDIALKNTNKDNITLIPGEQATLNYKANTLQIEETNVNESAAWIQGKFYFKNEKLQDILIKMERWYGFTTQFKTSEKANIRFTGVIKKDKSLRSLLDIISKTSNINYEIKKQYNDYEVIID